jgi:methyl-accepting chemotaxis protein
MAIKSVSTKLVIGNLAIAAAVVAATVLVLAIKSNSQDLTMRVFDVRIPAAAALAKADAAVRSVNGAMVSGLGADAAGWQRAQSKAAEAGKQLDAAVEQLSTMSKQWTEERNRQRLREAVEMIGQINAARQKFSADRSAQGPSMDLLKAYVDATSEAEAKASDRFANIRKAEEAAIAAEREKLESLDSQLQTSAIGLVIGTTVISIIIVMLVRHSVVRPLIAVANRAGRIAEGDLSAEPLPVLTEDEAGRLTIAVNGMQSSLRDIVAKARNAAINVAASGQQIAAASEELSRGADMQQGQIQNVSAAVTELTSSAESVAADTAKAANTARDTETAGQNGSQLISQAVESMHRIREAVAATSGAINSLSSKTDAIGGIVQIINDIADQTNLLALNAAIEAARAGEHGRGFAVVADEVRKLAERTTVATKQIVDSISEVRNESEGAVKRVAEGISTVETGVKQTETVGTELRKVIDQTSELAAVVQTIAQAAEQQKAALQGIAQSTTEVSNFSGQSTQAAQDVAKAATSLTSKSAELNSIVGKFNLGRENAANEIHIDAGKQTGGGKPSGGRQQPGGSKPASRPSQPKTAAAA